MGRNWAKAPYSGVKRVYQERVAPPRVTRPGRKRRLLARRS